jgi:hypothetical protein
MARPTTQHNVAGIVGSACGIPLLLILGAVFFVRRRRMKLTTRPNQNTGPSSAVLPAVNIPTSQPDVELANPSDHNQPSPNDDSPPVYSSSSSPLRSPQGASTGGTSRFESVSAAGVGRPRLFHKAYRPKTVGRKRLSRNLSHPGAASNSLLEAHAVCGVVSILHANRWVRIFTGRGCSCVVTEPQRPMKRVLVQWLPIDLLYVQRGIVFVP